MTNPSAEFQIRATDNTTRAFTRARSNLNGMRRGVNGMSGMMLRNRRIVQQAGFQLSDFAVQVGGGQSAILAFTQQFPQFIQGFGATGAVLAGLITVFGTLSLIAVRTGTSLDQLTPIAGVLEEEFQSLAAAVGVVKEAFFDFANLAINNVDRILVTVGVLAAFMAGRWVGSFVAARIATFSLVGALTVLKGAIIRTGFGILIIAAGELVFQIIQLSKSLGGFTETLRMVRDVFVEVWQRHIDLLQVFRLRFRAMGRGLEAMWTGTIAFLQEKWFKFIAVLSASAAKISGIPFFEDLAGDLAFAAATGGQEVDQLKSAVEGLNSASGNLSKQADILFKNLNKPLKSIEALREALRKANEDGSRIDIRDWFDGADEAGKKAKDTADKIKTLNDRVKDAITNSLDSFFDSVVDGGKNALDVLRDLGKQLAKLVLKAATNSFLSKLLPNLFGAGGFAPLVTDAGAVKFAKGGVIQGATPFAMSGGRTGLAGEAGPEAVLPLKRGSDGTLGVAAGLSGGGRGVTVFTQIVNQAPGVSIREERGTTTDGQVMRRFIVEEMNRAVANGETDRSNGSRFGVQPTRKVR